jgi:host factor-I protein
MDLRNRFLDFIKKNHEPLTIFLVSGVKLAGHIHEYDDFGVTLERGDTFQFIERHAISTYFPERGDLVLAQFKADNERF